MAEEKLRALPFTLDAYVIDEGVYDIEIFRDMLFSWTQSPCY